MTFTNRDREILNSYIGVLDGLCSYLGNQYEFVLHSLESYEHSVIKILNGYHTGRTEGAPITDLALDMLEKLTNDPRNCDSITYFSSNRNGEPLKSTTIAIRNSGKQIIGLLCINCYLNTSFYDVLSSFMPGAVPTSTDQIAENYADSIVDVISGAVDEVRKQVYSNASVPTALKNKEIVRMLYERGIFSIKDAVVRVSEILNISKNTIYLHIRNMSK